MKTLFVADPLSRLHPKSDTSLYLLRQMQKKGSDTFWTTSSDLFWFGSTLKVRASRLEKAEKSLTPKANAEEILELKQFDVVYIRKDPPFNSEYLNLCWYLSAFEKQIRFINPPSLLVRYHEKMLPLDAFVGGFIEESDLIETCTSNRYEDVKSFVEGLKSQSIICKPWFGYGGNGVLKYNREEFLRHPRALEGSDWMIQPYFEEVETTGDRRAFFFKGKYSGSFARIPKEGGFVSNLAQGGTPKDIPLTEKEERLVSKIEKWLKKIGILFAGTDFIAGRLSEVNITSPTGFAAYESLFGKDPAEDLINLVIP